MSFAIDHIVPNWLVNDQKQLDLDPALPSLTGHPESNLKVAIRFSHVTTLLLHSDENGPGQETDLNRGSMLYLHRGSRIQVGSYDQMMEIEHPVGCGFRNQHLDGDIVTHFPKIIHVNRSRATITSNDSTAHWRVSFI